MRKETQEWIHDVAYELIVEELKRLDAEVIRVPEEIEWSDRARQWISYVDAHYKPEEIKE